MRNLSPGVTVFFGDTRGCTDRIQLSLGTAPAPSSFRGLAYEEGARIPGKEWRLPSPDEQRILVATDPPTNYGTTISVIRIPPELLKPFQKIRNAASNFRKQDKILPLLNDSNCIAGIRAIKKYIQRHSECSPNQENEEVGGGIIVKARELPTVTVNPRSAVLVGLHLDDWYRFPLERREESPNRICINIGCEDRFFLFINLSIGQLCEAVSSASAQTYTDSGGTSIGRWFMRLFSSYPAIRVRIRPGEAYIAPTENIIHDGSSSGMATVDVSLSLRGRFELPSNVGR